MIFTFHTVFWLVAVKITRLGLWARSLSTRTLKPKAIRNKAGTQLTLLMSPILLQFKLIMKSEMFRDKLNSDKDLDFKASDNCNFPKPYVYAMLGKI